MNPAAACAVQIVVDCHDPHVLADWWAETLGWHVEPQDEQFIRTMITQGHATENDTRTYQGRLVWREATAINPKPTATPGQVRVLFQQVPEPKTVKNRLHLDIRPGDPAGVDDFRSRLVARGATIIGHGRQGPHTWVTMTDIEGNEFCL
jgi:Glyoxalase-like domain